MSAVDQPTGLVRGAAGVLYDVSPKTCEPVPENRGDTLIAGAKATGLGPSESADHAAARHVIEPGDHAAARMSIDPGDHAAGRFDIEPGDHVAARYFIEPGDHVAARGFIEPGDQAAMR